MKIQRSDQSPSVPNAPNVSGREKGNDSFEVDAGSTPKGDSFVSSDKGNDWISSSLRADASEARKKEDSSSDDKQLWDVRHSPGS